jgi:hypothetical protein
VLGAVSKAPASLGARRAQSSAEAGTQARLARWARAGSGGKSFYPMNERNQWAFQEAVKALTVRAIVCFIPVSHAK